MGDHATGQHRHRRRPVRQPPRAHARRLSLRDQRPVAVDQPAAHVGLFAAAAQRRLRAEQGRGSGAEHAQRPTRHFHVAQHPQRGSQPEQGAGPGWLEGHVPRRRAVRLVPRRQRELPRPGGPTARRHLRLQGHRPVATGRRVLSAAAADGGLHPGRIQGGGPGRRRPDHAGRSHHHRLHGAEILRGLRQQSHAGTALAGRVLQLLVRQQGRQREQRVQRAGDRVPERAGRGARSLDPAEHEHDDPAR